MVHLRSYLFDQWHEGGGKPRNLVNPSTEEVVATSDTSGIDFAAALHHAREVGGPALRAMSFAQRGELLKSWSRALHEHREELISLSALNNGATRGDAKFDVDGATGTLAVYARLGRELGEARLLLDGEDERLSSGARYVGQHVWMPRPGVAVHINAFNFPAWGTFEKVAAAILAGMPVITKPASATALTAWRMVDILVSAGLVPHGVLGFVAGSPGDLLDHLGEQDVLAFTGSANTGAALRAGEGVRVRSARVNVEADSLNAAVLGPDVGPGHDCWHTFVRNVVKDMTQKTGQKCTAIRRLIVPEAVADEVVAALSRELGQVVVGAPEADGVGMGPVATAAQLRDFAGGVNLLQEEAEVVLGGPDRIEGKGAPAGKGYFVAPTLLRVRDTATATRVHEHEVFGPCATVVPYSGSALEAANLVAKGRGCLVSSVYADERDWLEAFLLSAAPWNGRVVVVSGKVADQALAPGMVLPNQVHGGPGRAGGGEELGGRRGLDFYMNRVAIQGDKGLIRKVFGG